MFFNCWLNANSKVFEVIHGHEHEIIDITVVQVKNVLNSQYDSDTPKKHQLKTMTFPECMNMYEL